MQLHRKWKWYIFEALQNFEIGKLLGAPKVQQHGTPSCHMNVGSYNEFNF